MDLREESCSLDLESEGGELRSRVLDLRNKVPSRPLDLSKGSGVKILGFER